VLKFSEFPVSLTIEKASSCLSLPRCFFRILGCSAPDGVQACLVHEIDSPVVSALTYIQRMAREKHRRSTNLVVCPECGQVGTLRTILYGMPDPEVFDFEKYAVGGCCMNGDGRSRYSLQGV
jgi:hypothetical protein